MVLMVYHTSRDDMRVTYGMIGVALFVDVLSIACWQGARWQIGNTMLELENEERRMRDKEEDVERGC